MRAVEARPADGKAGCVRIRTHRSGAKYGATEWDPGDSACALSEARPAGGGAGCVRIRASLSGTKNGATESVSATFIRFVR